MNASVLSMTAVTAISATVATFAHAQPKSRSYAAGSFALTIGGAHAGWVRSVEGDAPARGEGDATSVSVRFDEVTPALARVVASWLDGKTLKADIALTSAAVVQRADGARITSVRVPAIGFGAPDPFEIGFEAKAIAKGPLLRPATDSAVPQGQKLTGFHVDLAGKPMAVAKLGELSLRRGPTGITPSELTLEITANETQPWIAWSKAPGTKPLRIDYVAADDKPVFRVTLEGCRPTSVRPTNGPTTRVALACLSTRP